MEGSQSDPSFGRAQDERQLMDEIWLLAGSEAYGAKDAARRLQEMTGQSRLQVIEAYFAANPEVKRWVDRNIEAGTCAAAVSELREKKERFREWRQERRGGAAQREHDSAFEWLRLAAEGRGATRQPPESIRRTMMSSDEISEAGRKARYEQWEKLGLMRSSKTSRLADTDW
jgi:hypothetical protein